MSNKKMVEEDIDKKNSILIDLNALDKKIKTFHYLRVTVLIIFITIVLFAGLFIYFYRETLTCSANPFLYGAKEVSKNNNNAEVYCRCQVFESSGIGKFSFTEEEFNPIDDPFINPRSPSPINLPFNQT